MLSITAMVNILIVTPIVFCVVIGILCYKIGLLSAKGQASQKASTAPKSIDRSFDPIVWTKHGARRLEGGGKRSPKFNDDQSVMQRNRE